MKGLCLNKPIGAPDLVKEIIRKAQGVFIRVNIVIASLLRGIEYNDNISVLQNRLRDLPPEMEELYLYMLNRVEPVHRCVSHTDYIPFCGINLSFAEELDESRVLNMASFILDDNQIRSRIEEVDRRLRICCAGLIEPSNPSRTIVTSNNLLLQGLKPLAIRYSHRAPFDFIQSPIGSKFISKGILGPHFNAHVQLIIASTALLSICSLPSLASKDS
ncbi:hypothetical protein WAI453_005448 [Rhynchosporium graminicola]